MNFSDHDLREMILAQMPSDGAAIGNIKMMDMLKKAGNADLEKKDYERIRDQLIDEGILISGAGRGGSVKLAGPEPSGENKLTLESEPPVNPLPRKKWGTRKTSTTPSAGKSDQKEVISYRYSDKRKNNPHVGMVDTASDGVEEHTGWAFDVVFDPAKIPDAVLGGGIVLLIERGECGL